MKKLMVIFILFSIAVFAQTKPIKVDAYTLQIEKSESTTEIVTYDFDFLLEQRVRIIADVKQYVLVRKKEIAELDSLIFIAKNLGIISKSKEEGDND